MSTFYQNNTNNAFAAHKHASRFGFKWNVNECLCLQREFELLRLSVPEIAELHSRTVKAIMYKIDAEGFASFNDLYVQTYGQQGGQQGQQQEELELNANLETDSEPDSDSESPDSEYEYEQEQEQESCDSESESEDDGSNIHFLYGRVKSMQKQINAILGYFTAKHETINGSTYV
jgi:hypothetical protein